MNNCYVNSVGRDFFPEPSDDVMESIFKSYERVIVESIITSFGLDFLVNDQHGGDVDTINNVRQVGKDSAMDYKNEENRAAYSNREEYDSRAYHSHERYIEKNREVRRKKDAGILIDDYTGAKISRNEKSDLDHGISGKEIHDDPARSLAGLKGVDLANSPENLQATNPRTNRTKKAEKMDDFLKKYGEEYSDEQKSTMRKKDKESRKSYEKKLATAYYTSPKFAKDLTFSAGKVGLKMGLRQALGLVLTEVWFSVKDEFEKVDDRFELEEFFFKIGSAILKGIENAKEKYKEILSRFKDGAISGVLSSITTTLCNIFSTTAKNTIKIIRQSYVSLVQAAKILLLNPDNLLFGERLRAVAKLIATGASVVVGGLVSEVIGKSGIAQIPIVGGVASVFCGSLVTGVMSCSFLYYFDRNETINKLVRWLDTFPSIDADVNYYTHQAKYFENYAAELMEIDIAKFREEAIAYDMALHRIDNAKDETACNLIVKDVYEKIGIKVPWEGCFNDRMIDKKYVLKFE